MNDFDDWFGQRNYRHYRPSQRRECVWRCALVMAFASSFVALGMVLTLVMQR